MPTPRALRPFSTPQYRILTVALLMSLLGAGVWLVAVVWEVIALGGGPADLSLVATGASVGLVGAVLIGGVVVLLGERWRPAGALLVSWSRCVATEAY